jgi:hypothetical protein
MKKLLLFKMGVKNVLSQRQYQIIAKYYRRGPFRRYLIFKKKPYRNTFTVLANHILLLSL